MNRRKAIGALVGGAVAGPQIAKEAMASTQNMKLSSMPMANYAGVEGGMETAKSISDLDRVNDLKATIAGKFNEYQQDEIDDAQRQFYNIHVGHYNSLKSVSDMYKIQKQHEMYVNQTKQR